MKWKTFGIQLLITLLLTVLLEAVLSFFLAYPGAIPFFLEKPFQAFYKASDRSIIQVTDCAQYDPELFYRLSPGECSFRNREFDVINRVNSMGLRDDEQSLVAPSIIMLGDSYTMGWGIPQEETFPDLLEEQLDMRVLNAGISSFGTAREVKLLRELNRTNLRYLIIQYHPNDFEENKASQLNDYTLPIKTRKDYDSLKEAISIRQSYYPFKYVSGFTKTVLLNSVRPEAMPVGDSLQAKTFLDILLHSPVKDEGYHVLVFKIDDHDKLTDGFADAVDALLKKEPYSQLDISTVRISDVLSRSDYFTLDEHINEQGSKKLAVVLYQHILNMQDRTKPQIKFLGTP